MRIRCVRRIFWSDNLEIRKPFGFDEDAVYMSPKVEYLGGLEVVERNGAM